MGGLGLPLWGSLDFLLSLFISPSIIFWLGTREARRAVEPGTVIIECMQTFFGEDDGLLDTTNYILLQRSFLFLAKRFVCVNLGCGYVRTHFRPSRKHYFSETSIWTNIRKIMHVFQ